MRYLALLVMVACVPEAAQPDFITSHGIELYLDGYEVDVSSLEAATEDLLTLEEWFTDALKWAPVSCEFVSLPFYASDYGIPFPDDPPLAGLAIPLRRHMFVGFDPDIDRTGFSHELIHILQGTPHMVPYYP